VCLQDAAIVRDLSEGDFTGNVKGWLQEFCGGLVQIDLSAIVAASDTLLHLHSTAEQYEATAEDFLAPFQVGDCALE